MARAVLAVCAAALVCAGSSAAARMDGPTAQDVTITGSGGVQLACTLFLPGGTPPSGGWPGLVLFPGLADPAAPGIGFVAAGFASVACDERGTGGSAGFFDLAGPNDAADAQAIFDWLAARPEVSDTQIGAEGSDLGGAEVWNAAVAGVPFKAIATADAWSSLDRALRPTGVLNAKLFELLSAEGPTTWNTAPGIATRSYRKHLHALTVPTLILHSRANDLVDLDQATAAYRLLGGPKRLVIGWSATQPPPDQAIAWFTHYLAGGPPVARGVALQHEQPDAAITAFSRLPRIRTLSVDLPGRVLKRSVWLPGGPLETFGAGSVTIRYARASWKQVVATVSTADGTLVTEGAAAVTRRAGVLKIPLLNEMALLPRGKKLVLALGNRDSEFGGSGAGKIAVSRVTLTLSVLQRAVSR
jgi:hypothetical protein